LIVEVIFTLKPTFGSTFFKGGFSKVDFQRWIFKGAWGLAALSTAKDLPAPCIP